MQRSRVPRAGPEGYILVLALLIPLVVMGIAVAQLPGVNLGTPSTLVYSDDGQHLATSHPASLNAAPPPTLAVPTATPKPTAVPPTAVPPTAVPTVQPTSAAGARTYTVQRGDELKHIAAQYNVSIWSIIDSNNIPNPDSLRVGQVLQIPNT